MVGVLTICPTRVAVVYSGVEFIMLVVGGSTIGPIGCGEFMSYCGVLLGE